MKKVVINDNGGTKVATNFSFKVDGGSSTAFLQDSDALHGKNTLTVAAGSHSVVEADTPIAGYTTTYDNCSNVSVANGATQTCTITNDDVAGTLIVKKVVINDNGGTKVATNFSFKVDGGSSTAFLQDSDALHGKNTLTVAAGSHSVVEADTPIAGYTTTYDNCSNVSVANGATQTCTITNDDVAGTLIVKKVVINDEGGTKTAGEFSFKVGNAAPVAFVQDGQDSLKGQNSVNVAAGTYSVTEPAVSGYVASYDACSNIVVGNGETKTCTITNNDNIPPTVDVQKTVRVAGSEDAYAETASAPEPGGTFQYNVVVWNQSKEAVTLTALTDTIGGIETSLDGEGTCDVPQSLAASDGTSGGADTYTCTFELTFNGNAGASQVDTVKATVEDDENDTATDQDNASVSLTNVNPAIDVQKTVMATGSEDEFGETASLPEPGGEFTYKVVVTNTSTASSDSLTITSLTDDVYGDLTKSGAANPKIGSTNCDTLIGKVLVQGATAECQFIADFEGNNGDTETDTVTAVGTDDDQHSVSDTDTASVSLTDTPSSILVTKTANPTQVQDSGTVTFSVVVANTSDVDTVYIDSFVDSIYGNLNGKGTCTARRRRRRRVRRTPVRSFQAIRTHVHSRRRSRRPRRTWSPRQARMMTVRPSRTTTTRP